MLLTLAVPFFFHMKNKVASYFPREIDMILIVRDSHFNWIKFYHRFYNISKKQQHFNKVYEGSMAFLCGILCEPIINTFFSIVYSNHDCFLLFSGYLATKTKEVIYLKDPPLFDPTRPTRKNPY